MVAWLQYFSVCKIMQVKIDKEYLNNTNTKTMCEEELEIQNITSHVKYMHMTMRLKHIAFMNVAAGEPVAMME